MAQRHMVMSRTRASNPSPISMEVKRALWYQKYWWGTVRRQEVSVEGGETRVLMATSRGGSPAPAPLLTSHIVGLLKATVFPGQRVIKRVAKVEEAPGHQGAVVQAHQDTSLGGQGGWA